MPERYIGLISGTSLDAVDAVLLEIDADKAPRITGTHAEAPPADLRVDLLTATAGATPLSLQQLGELHQRTGAWFADAANHLMTHAGLAPTAVRAIGSHGQTLCHAPDAHFPFSCQLGDPSLIAMRTGLTTVADFRQADMAAGGQGAPMVPAFHHAVFASDNETRCIVNIGGIANITVLPAGGAGNRVTGFDTGPGNALLDAWVAQHLGQYQDTDAAWAVSGEIDSELLARLRADAYFQLPPPKSTGRESFHLEWLQHQLETLTHTPTPADVQRTLVELTAGTIGDAITAHASATDRVLLCGGGAHNPLLRERLAAHLPDRPVTNTCDYGIEVDWVEAAAFAWLAMRTLRRLPGNLPSVTGARNTVVLGGIYDP